MDFLVNAMHRPKANGIPSWCVDFLTPDWSRYAWNCGWYLSVAKNTESNERKPPSTVSYDVSQGSIEVLATCLGCVDHVHASKCAPSNLSESEKTRYFENYRAEHPDAEQRKFQHRQFDRLVEDIKTFRDVGQTFLKNPFSTNEVLENFCLGIRQDLYQEELSLYRNELLSYDYLALVRRAEANSERHGANLAYRRLKLIAAICANLIDKTLFSIDSGYLGQAATAVDTIMKGDKVFIIHGCQVPVVLRRRQDSAACTVVTFSWISKLTTEQICKVMGGICQKITLS
ncbi:MAG: hypothetical protein Q9222_005636 [Ikaeria aurantiellina]